MKLISHRGNIDGKFELYENEPNYIDEAIKKGFDVEIDIWYIENESFGKMLFLGHDKPQYGIDFKWISDRIDKLWIHCKNIEAVEFFSSNKNNYNFFWHEADTLTLTSHKYIWVYPGKQPIMNSIAVMPELNGDLISDCLGICSDFISGYTRK